MLATSMLVNPLDLPAIGSTKAKKKNEEETITKRALQQQNNNGKNVLVLTVFALEMNSMNYIRLRVATPALEHFTDQ